MKITGIEPITCDSGIGGRDWLFVKVTTDEGIVGWGEGYDWQASSSLAEAIRVVGQEVIGQDPRRIDLISRRLWHSGRAGVPERMKVIAALELALYDIKGKWLGVPCYDLIGGLYRDRIPLYWSHFASYRVLDGPAMGTPPATTIADWVALVDDVEKAGFKALKTNLLIPGLASGLPPTLDGAIDKWRINAAVEFVGALRDRCGPNIGILFDVGQEYRMGGIVQLGRALEPFNLYWLEAEGFDPDALLAARQQTRTRICHGEALIGRQAFRPFFEKHVTDVVMIETLNNGFTEARKIADLAAHYDTMFSPHNYMSPLSNLINAHLCAALPNCEILEIDMDDVPWKWDIIDQKIDIENGELLVPKRPGWGANVVESEVAKHPLKGHARPEFLSSMAAVE
jgi:L-alanine-DL-glutamate epimerase-like enolase superfamily enzyme